MARLTLGQARALPGDDLLAILVSGTNPDQTAFTLPTDAVIDTGDIEIGAVELKNAADDTRAKIAALNALVVGDIGLGVADPVLLAALIAILGATNNAAVLDADGTINAHVRGAVQQLVAVVEVLEASSPESLGQLTMANSLPIAIASDQSAVPITRAKVSLTGSAPTLATVGVASAEAVPVNAARKGLVLVNTSTAWISLAFGAAAVLYSGITLSPNGGAFTMDEYTFTTAQVRAIASGAASNLAVQEMTT